MKQHWISRYWWIPVLCAGAGLSSFTLFDLTGDNAVIPGAKCTRVLYAQLKDTIPGKDSEREYYHFKTGELDNAIKEMETEIEKAQSSFKNIQWPNIDLEMKKAMQQLESIDRQKIKMDIEKSIKNVDWKKMQLDINASLKALELELPKIQLEVNEKLTQQLDEATRTLEKTKKELALQQEKMKLDMHQSFNESMKNLDKQLAKAKSQLESLKEMSAAMEKDGLIKQGENADILFKKGDLYINGQKQPIEVTNKYKHYFKKQTGDSLYFSDDNDDWL